MLLLGHPAHIPSTLKSLSILIGQDLDIEIEAGIMDANDTAKIVTSKSDHTVKVIVTTSEMASKRLGRGLILIVPDAWQGETHSTMIERIVADFCDDESLPSKNVCVVHSSLDVLKRCKPFLGEDA